MKKMQRIGGERRPTSGLGGMLALLSGSLAQALSISLLVIIPTAGCVNQRLVELQSGQSCSAEKVQQYADAHNLTYEQALDECRRRDQEDWDAEESRQAGLVTTRGADTKVDTAPQTPTPSSSPL